MEQYVSSIFESIRKREFTEDEIRDAARKLGIDLLKYDFSEILLGMPIELEHGTQAGLANLTDDETTDTLQIVIAHLDEFEKYYSELLIPAQREARERGNPVRESDIFDNSFYIRATDGSGYITADFLSGHPTFDPDPANAYSYTELEARDIAKLLDVDYGIKVDVIPYADVTGGLVESVLSFTAVVPMFEDYGDNSNLSNWSIGPDGSTTGMRDFDFKDTDDTMKLNSTEMESLVPYYDLLKQEHKVFNHFTEPYKLGDSVMFEFGGPTIKNGPYAGKDPWWVLSYDAKGETYSLFNSETHDNHEFSNLQEFGNVIDTIVSDFYR